MVMSRNHQPLKTVNPLLSMIFALAFFTILSAFTGSSVDDEDGHHHGDPEHHEWTINDPQWGTLVVSAVEDPRAATNRHLVLTVKVHCHDQNKTKRTIQPPQQYEVSKVTGLCHIDPPAFDKTTKVMKVRFHGDSGYGDGFDEICDIPMNQTFALKEICARWAPKP